MTSVHSKYFEHCAAGDLVHDGCGVYRLIKKPIQTIGGGLAYSTEEIGRFVELYDPIHSDMPMPRIVWRVTVSNANGSP